MKKPMKVPTKTSTGMPMAKGKKNKMPRIAEAGQPVQGAAMAMPSPAVMADMKRSIKKDKGPFKR